jgi:DNA-binding LacI/PurR family transcriptional regulator
VAKRANVALSTVSYAINGTRPISAKSRECIPNDFSTVFVVTAAPLAEMTFPIITTAQASTSQLGRLGTEMLIQQLEGINKEFSEVLIPCKLTTRESSAKCPPARLASIPEREERPFAKRQVNRETLMSLEGERKEVTSDLIMTGF